MAATRAPAARCMTILLTFAVLLGHPQQALGLQRPRVDVGNRPSYEELTTSLVVNQLATLQLMQDVSNATSCCAKTEARREEDAKLQDIGKEIKDLRAVVEKVTQETLKGMEEREALRDAKLQEIGEGLDHLKTIVEKATQAMLKDNAKTEARREEEAAQQDAQIQDIGKEIKDLRAVVEKAKKETPKACPDGWLRHESSCYLVDRATLTWQNSRTACRNRGGDLAKITSAEEHEFIKGNLARLNECCYWIGLNDIAREGHFVWTDGSAPTFTRWNKGQPDDRRSRGGEDCAHMHRPYNFEWFDYSCGSIESVYNFGFVCERPAFA